MSKRKKQLLILLPAALVLVGTALLGRHAAMEHVRHYTGIEPTTVNCTSCHFTGYGGTIADRIASPRYRSPFNLAVSPDGRRLYATASGADSLLVVDLEAGRTVAEIPVGERPHGVVLSGDGKRAYVSNEISNTVDLVDLEALAVEATIPASDGPRGLAVSRDGSALFVAGWFGGDIEVFDLPSLSQARLLSAGSNPYHMALTVDGSHLLITNQLSYPVSRPGIPETEVTVVDVKDRTIAGRIPLRNAHLVEGIAVAPEGDLALVTLVRPKNLLPAIGVARGWMMTNGLGAIDLAKGRAVQVVLDEPGACYADPCDVAIVPDGKLAFVSHSGSDTVTALDMGRLREVLRDAKDEDLEGLAEGLGTSRRFVRARIPTGANPKGLAVSPDGKRVYVAERLADRIAVIDVGRMEVTARIDVGVTDRETVVRRGERLFNSASHTFQNQFSCRSCHPSNHADRLQYDFEPDGLGRNIVDNRSLLGIVGTGPFKWDGKNTSMYMQCGMRFAKILTRVEPFPPEDLNALVAFLRSLRTTPNRHRLAGGELTSAQLRGKALFERALRKDGTPIEPKDRCITCHPPPLFTNRKKADVGSSSTHDLAKDFDVPQLLNVYQSAPYLHDGKATTLEQIWTLFNPYDTHGITFDFSKSDLNDLIEYLKTL